MTQMIVPDLEQAAAVGVAYVSVTAYTPSPAGRLESSVSASYATSTMPKERSRREYLSGEAEHKAPAAHRS